MFEIEMSLPVARFLGALVILAGLLAAGPVCADPPRKIALVIGNAEYQHVDRLSNPVSDATSIAAVLTTIGFDVDLATNLTGRNFVRRLADFQLRTDGADVAVVYYAGHGVQLDGGNFLVPIDAETDRGPTGLRLQSIDLDSVLRAGAGARAALYLLDACRETPSRGLGVVATARGGSTRGLAIVEPRMPQTVISFATSPGEVALDGAPGTASPYATALAKHLGTPGLDVQQILTRVTGAVSDATSRRQRPWTNASLDRELFLSDRPADATAGAQPAPGPDGLQLTEALAWAHVSTSTDPRELELFLQRYPAGALAPFARFRLQSLPVSAATVVTAAQPQLATPTNDGPPPQARTTSPATDDKGGPGETATPAAVRPRVLAERGPARPHSRAAYRAGAVAQRVTPAPAGKVGLYQMAPPANPPSPWRVIR